MTMWAPLQQGLIEVQSMLAQAVDPKASTETLNQARTRLEQLSTKPEFIRYLTFVFVTSSLHVATSHGESDVRALAGITLKNELRRNWELMDAGTLNYVHESILPCLQDANRLIRSITAHVLAMLIAKTPLLKNGSPVLSYLQKCVKQEENDFLADGASLALLFIAEDATSILDLDENGRPLKELIPFWIRQCEHIKPLLRERALDCIEIFFARTPPSLEENIEAFLASLSRLHNDASPRVRRRVLRGLCSFVTYMPQKLNESLFSSIALFALKAMEDEDDEVSKEGCEFFDVALQDNSPFISLMKPILPSLIPSLMKKITYTEEDLFDIETEIQADSHLPDSDISPFFSGFGANWGAMRQSGMPSELNRDKEDFDNDDDDNDGPYWTTRRTACLVLDALSKKMEAKSFAAPFVPPLFARLESRNWLEREGAILALGAVAEGGVYQELLPYLPRIIPFLLQQACDESQVLIRKISLWAISKFSVFVVNSFLQPALDVILTRFQDRNKNVQNSSICSLQEIFKACNNKDVLIPYLPVILERMTLGITQLQTNNVIYMFDAFTELFKTKPTCDYLGDPNLMKIYLPTIWDKFTKAPPTDPTLSAMTWFLSQACFALGDKFSPLAEQGLNRCSDVMEESISVADSFLEMGEPFGQGDFEHLVGTLQFVSSIITCSKFDLMQSATTRRCIQLVFRCASSLPDLDVKECAIGVLGDLCCFCPAILQGSESVLFVLLVVTLEDFDNIMSQPNVGKNALWAFGELLKISPNVESEIIHRTVLAVGSILIAVHEKDERALDIADDAAILMAAISLRNLEQVQSSFEQIGTTKSHSLQALSGWTKILFRMSEEQPKRSLAIEGWTSFIGRRLDLGTQILPMVLASLASFDFRNSDPQVHSKLVALLKLIRNGFGSNQAEWMKKINVLSGQLRNRLIEVYGTN